MNIEKKLIVAGAIFGAVGVMLGAMAAHVLKTLLSESSLTSFNTGVRYQIYHALFLLMIAALGSVISDKMKKAIYLLVVSGIILFSGSIYFLSVGPMLDLNMSFLGPVTPLGGLLLITSWILLIVAVLKGKD